MEVDLRSEEAASLAELDARVRKAIDAAVTAENARWRHSAKVSAEVRLVGDRPAGRTPDTSDIVRAAGSVLSALRQRVVLDTSSTDANVAMARGVPAITIGGGGTGEGAHSLDESFDTVGAVEGLRQAILLGVALAQP
jgi:acetylornithine deacetylase/succinyl-diaminopimelate desuccinylase-like protein